MINETRVRALQSAYLVTRKPTFLFHYQQEVQNIIKKIMYYKLIKSGVIYPQYKMEEISHDASIRFIEQYIRNTEYVCMQFSSRLNKEALFALYDKKIKAKDRNEMPLYEDMSICVDVKEDDTWVIEDIMSDTIYWRNVLLDCYKATSFKKFLITISAYVSVQWITDHVKRLKKLYKNTRRI